tara:strand:+ start:229 stop:801 length:573 start_codon:yes stop_codon:yes gene_type:complete
MINFNFPILKNKFKKHSKLKQSLLDLINNQETGSLKQFDSYYDDSISRVDWDRRSDFQREWVKLINEDLINNFDNQVKKIGLKNIRLIHLWFQQYFKGDTHGWHVHGNNFTGVYYLEFSKCAPRTQIIEPISKRLIEVEAKEGEIIIFPSVYIHRASKSKSKKRKTIISFNFECDLIDDSYLKKIKKLYK